MVYHNFVYFAKLPEVLRLFQDVLVRQPRAEPDDEDEILLDDPDLVEVLPVLRYLLFLCLVLLPLLSLDLGQFFCR